MEQPMTGNEIRRQFLDYFKTKGHQEVRSSSLVPADDPTLLFTNAGMVQFKRTFLGEEARAYQRATTSQKCVRAGGKHNDLENVGYTARHHTFFEMLGNFSFGDYFKEKAVEYAWDLLVNGYGLPADQLWVSVYLDDDEAWNLWHKNIGVPAERIVRFGEKDNFWAMGDTGPCGPCSEILIDRGAAFGCGKPDCKVGCECDRYLEIWNLVFMQYNRDASGTLTPLPKPSIDTGMGLERIVSVMQNVATNYDTDLMMPIIAKAESLSGKTLGAAADSDVAMKVIADHSRAAAFLIGDGVLPANEGRGYVLRRIMRRAIRYGRNIGLSKPFLHETVEEVFRIMKPAYPELTEASAFITNVIRNEELRFSETLDHGLRILNDSLEQMQASGKTRVPGEVIFKLYDTYGFPVDIVRDVVRDRGMSLDMDGFDAAMGRQRTQSRTVSTFSNISDAYKTLSAQGFKPSFTGYEHLTGESVVRLMVKDGQAIDRAQAGDHVEIVCEATPFYGESGGQVGDCGTMTAEGMQVVVSDTLKDPTGLIIHRGEVVSGSVSVGDRVRLAVDAKKRAATACNHSATHILHAVLRQVLGDHVKQAGSLVSWERLRFDFTHFSQVDADALARIETLVNARIRQNVAVDTVEMDAEKAFQSGAMALFEEKYGDRVRVISLESFSKELCGGTHTGRTGDIGLFRIVAESSVAAGIRRIEAVTGQLALNFSQQQTALLTDTARLIREKPENVPQRVARLLAEHKHLEKQLEALKAQMVAQSAEQAAEQIQMVGDVKVLVQQVRVESPGALRDLADRFKEKLKSGIVVLGAVADAKVLLIAGVTRDLTGRYPAGKIVKAVAELVGGSGGGRPDMAQAGGTQPENLPQALSKVVELIENW
jgi:alanyl-tRNA synthetase